MKKKILILGPIGDFGGREIETKIIIDSLVNVFDVKLLSLSYITEKSFVLTGDKNFTWTSLDKEIYKNNFRFRVLALLSYLFNNIKKKPYGYVNNKFSKKKNLYYQHLLALNKEIKKVDTVIYCGQLSSFYVKEIIKISKKEQKKLFFRTTGTIRQIPLSLKACLPDSKLFIHNSLSNAKRLNNQIELPFTIIDQCSLLEHRLLKIPLKIPKTLRFGFLGRFAEEKGIVPLVKYMVNKELPFVIAGFGPQANEIKEIISINKCKYIGPIDSHEIAVFFNQIDVLIIPSYEEAGPLVAIEGLAAGKVIISTKVGAMEERLIDSKNQFWFEIENINTLDKVIYKIQQFNKKELLNLMKENRELYKTHFSLQVIKNKYLEVIK